MFVSPPPTSMRLVALPVCAHTQRFLTLRATSNLASRYTTLDGDEYCVETDVKRSRFVAWAFPVASPEAALLRVAARRDAAASHNCWAFRIGQQYRSSDDGEPGGTAGRPILAAIEAEGLDGICVLVVRHYGGIKLGTGGLVRAYAGAARECLRAAPRREVVPRSALRAIVPFDALGTAYQLAEAQGATILGEDYEGGGGSGVLLRLSVQLDRAEQLQAALRNGSCGRIDATLEPAPCEQ